MNKKLWILKNDRKGSRSPVTTTSTSISVTSAGIVDSNGGNSSGNETKTGETNNSNSDIKWAEKRKLQQIEDDKKYGNKSTS